MGTKNLHIFRGCLGLETFIFHGFWGPTVYMYVFFVQMSVDPPFSACPACNPRLVDLCVRRPSEVPNWEKRCLAFFAQMLNVYLGGGLRHFFDLYPDPWGGDPT